MNLHVRQIDPMNLTDEQIAELEQLDRESCPAPWHMHERGQEVLTSQSHPLATLSDGSHRLIEGRRGVHVGKDGPLIVAARNALPSLLAEVRSSRSSPDTAPWYEADGSTVMLPAEEVTRRRKLAAKVIGTARSVVRDLYYADGPGGLILNELRARLADLDAVSPSPSGRTARPPRTPTVDAWSLLSRLYAFAWTLHEEDDAHPACPTCALLRKVSAALSSRVIPGGA